MMSTDPKDKYWSPLWQDIEAKLLSGVTDGREVYRTFSSELDEWAQYSPILKKILVEERAKRDIASENVRSEEHTSELQSLMRISYAVFCLKKKKESNRKTTKHII